MRALHRAREATAMMHTTNTPDTSLTAAINIVGVVCLSLILVVFTSLALIIL